MQRIGVDFVVELVEGRCTGCRECLPHCAAGALLWIPGEDTLLIDAWACTGCGSCTTACPEQALHMQVRHSL